MEKTALITGASNGIGAQYAKIFAEKGYNLVISARSEQKLNNIKGFLEEKYRVAVTVIAMDLAVDNSADILFKRVKNQNICIDVLVNNAGFGDHSEFLRADFSKQQRMINLNITALMRLSYLFGNDMLSRGKGEILNMSSATAFSAGANMSVYYATKAFVLSFSQSLSSELKGVVKVTALCPGPVSTNFAAAANMSKSSKLFSTFPSTPQKTARAGYNALKKGKSVKYHGIVAYAANLISRLTPRKTAGNMAKKLNGVPDQNNKTGFNK